MAENKWATRLPVTKSKAELAYETLRAAIAGGDLQPGERINMDDLARQMGVSKIPIREAVKRLESEGLVDSRVHAGVIVAGVDHSEMRGVFLAREAIEGLVGRLAAERATDQVLAGLEEIQQTMRDMLDAGSTDGLPELNSEFHRRLADAAGYRILGDLTEQLLLTIRRYRIAAPIEQNWRSVVDEHAGIIEALRAGEPEAVATACRSHIVSQAGREIVAPPA